jgi:hypothetical protein
MSSLCLVLCEIQPLTRACHHTLVQGRATLSLSGPDTLSFNITLNRPFDLSNQLQSVLLSVPAFINSSAVTLAALYGPNVTNVQMVRYSPLSTFLQ